VREIRIPDGPLRGVSLQVSRRPLVARLRLGLGRRRRRPDRRPVSGRVLVEP